ncbi:MAG TPA: hypothetical protein VFQ23_15505 [Anaerolineales bacterium]|nr:hypothetical protein [Anaerolineales bacterium]
MQTGKGQVVELILQDGLRHARLNCPENLVPAPGQYLLVGHDPSDPLPVPIFSTDSVPNGFIVAPPIPESWSPGRVVNLRGPLGKGFSLPSSAKRVALVAIDISPSRLSGLIRPALLQEASVVVVSDLSVLSLPDEVEIQPLSALNEVAKWADYIACDVAREGISPLRDRLIGEKPSKVSFRAQVLVRTPIPCGGLAECGVCAVTSRSGWGMACKDGPVFDWTELI